MSEQQHKPVIGISLGDYNGIGPEVILKALHGNQLNKHFVPVIYGSMRVLNRYKHLFDMKDWTLNAANTVAAINPKLVNVITCFDDSQTTVEPGKVTTEAGKAAYESLSQAVQDLKAGHIAALVTAPINKHTIQSEEFKFPGHTEYLAESFQATEYLMFMVSERLKIGVVSGHVPLSKVRTQITQDSVSKKLTQILKSLREDFGLIRPRVAVLGLNPHAGEDGLLGNEEKEIITPVIEQFRKKNQLVYGPFPSDGFFGAASWKKFDAILAMYHDQGLMPFKMLAFEDGVNFTAGLSVVRTSPDHGTAYDIAGKNLADPGSMLHAIYTALDIIRNRDEWQLVRQEREDRENELIAMPDTHVTEERDSKEITGTEPRREKSEQSTDTEQAPLSRENRFQRNERKPRPEGQQPQGTDRQGNDRQGNERRERDNSNRFSRKDRNQRNEQQPRTEPQARNEQPRQEQPRNEQPRPEQPESPKNEQPRTEEKPGSQAPARQERSQQLPQDRSQNNREERSRENRFPKEGRPSREERNQRNERREKPGNASNKQSPQQIDRQEAQLGLMAISQSLLNSKTPPNQEPNGPAES